MKTLYLATQNTNKVQEWQQLFAVAKSDWTVQAGTTIGDVPETGYSFEENARIKAVAWGKTLPQDAWVVGEDSGLCIDALNGAPGLYSARVPGQNNAERVQYVLKQLADVPEEKRTARFVCALVLRGPQGESCFEDTCEGHITLNPTGEQGFGYDPIFQPIGHTQTFAELGTDMKHTISHRAKAIGQLLAFLRTVQIA